jgi:hypothetical protein
MRLRIPPPPPEPPRTTASKVRNFALGVLLFGPVDFLVFAFSFGLIGGGGGSTPGITVLPALGFAAIVALVALLFIYLKHRMLAAGWVSGYLLMSLVSVGACTLIVDPRASNGVGSGLAFYGLIFLLAGLTAVVSLAWRR